MAEPYVSIGIITPSYNHLVYIGLGLHVRIRSGRIIISAFLHDAIFWVMCGVQFNLESMTTANIFSPLRWAPAARTFGDEEVIRFLYVS
jgi:hypothetical protein